MFEKFLSANVEAFRQRYEGTYGFYRDENKKRLLVRLESIGTAVCAFVDANGIEYRLNTNSERDIGFEFLPPRSAWYNVEEGAYYTQRLAQRQFSRGVTDRNLGVYYLNKDRMWRKEIDFPTLAALYEGAMTPKEAIGRLGNRSFALSRQFALDRAGVWLLEEKIGTYRKEKDKVFLTLAEPDLWRTELTDAFAAIEHPVEIS